MHSYLRAIGFSKLEQKDLDQILQEVIASCDEKDRRAGKKRDFGGIVPIFWYEYRTACLCELMTSRINFGWNIIFRILPEAVSPVRKM